MYVIFFYFIFLKIAKIKIPLRLFLNKTEPTGYREKHFD